MSMGFFKRNRALFLVAVLGTLAVFETRAAAESDVATTDALRQARAHWLAPGAIAWNIPDDTRVRLHFSTEAGLKVTPVAVEGGESIELTRDGVVSGALAQRFPHLAKLPLFRIPAPQLSRVPGILKAQSAVSAFAEGRMVDATALQTAGVLDVLFTWDGPLGVTFKDDVPHFRLWAPTAQSVKLLLFDDAAGSEPSVHVMKANPEHGTWALAGNESWDRKFYLYEVEVYVRRTGRIERNRVSDPYSHGLSMDSRRSQIVNLFAADLAPEGWQSLSKPALEQPEDIVLYELHVRDFSIGDATVPAALRGTFKAFTRNDSNGMRHLESLAAAGLTHVHLLPAFDCATIPENPADRREPPDLSGFAPDSDHQQAAVAAVRSADGFNWCYDPFHYTVPEGSYSTDPDGVSRIREFREMVAALNRGGLRVVMDVVYNHTTSAGQAPNSVLDRIVPDYYQRLDATGEVETSTCCANTATENAMMEKLMVDSLLTWARQYKVDGFRFDLMGHHSRANIEKVRDALRALTVEEDGVDGSSIYLYGEGWNFGEVADGARFVQAIQTEMGAGTGVGTFNDRLRDAVRGGAHDDEGIEHLRTQGFVNGLYTDPNAENTGSDEEKARLLHFADLVRAGLAGNLADFRFTDRFGNPVKAGEVDYNGQGAAYASDPQESINYVAAHDNETLFDINQYKLPRDTAMADRARAVNLANSIVALAQGIPFYHAGQELLRSKSLDSNSFDSGDWFNPLDFSYRDNGWGRGLPPAWDNEANWPLAGPLLADASLAPGEREIRFAAKHLKEMLRIRKSTPLFRMGTADEVMQSLQFLNTGPQQVPGLIVMRLEGDGETVVVLFNTTPAVQSFAVQGAAGFELHPVQKESADPVVRRATVLGERFEVPARTTAVFVKKPAGIK